MEPSKLPYCSMKETIYSRGNCKTCGVYFNVKETEEEYFVANMGKIECPKCFIDMLEKTEEGSRIEVMAGTTYFMTTEQNNKTLEIENERGLELVMADSFDEMYDHRTDDDYEAAAEKYYANLEAVNLSSYFFGY